MNKFLIIYDNAGIIYYIANDNYVIPQGLQYLEVTVPDGYHIAGVDVEKGEAIIAENEKSEKELLREDIDGIMSVLDFLLME